MSLRRLNPQVFPARWGKFDPANSGKRRFLLEEASLKHLRGIETPQPWRNGDGASDCFSESRPVKDEASVSYLGKLELLPRHRSVQSK